MGYIKPCELSIKFKTAMNIVPQVIVKRDSKQDLHENSSN